MFNASAKFNGTALNDVIYQGPKLQNDLFNVLLRFRRYPVALICDIAEMYLRVQLHHKDRSYHRFLWRGMNTEQKPLEYEFNSLVFGINLSPFLAQFVSQHHATVHKQQYPRAAEVILKSTYMDDSMDSVIDETEGVELYKKLSELWQKAGMQTHKWLSNSLKVLENIPPQYRAPEVSLDGDEISAVKTLGVLWLATDDVFTFKSDVLEKFQPSKRNFLKRIATLFDPLGMLSPFVIRAKMLMQEIWVRSLDWDDPLPEELSVKMISWFAELPMLSKIRVPRCLQLEEFKSATLHVFVDASQDAYGAVVYMRSEKVGGKEIIMSFVASKTKVAPLQSLSIPRLELMAAVLGKRLALSIAKILNIDRKLITFWTDSTSVIWWIRGYSRQFKPFIANRIGEIQTSTNPDKWRYVPAKENSADYLTRGATVAELSQLKVWWEGPTFLLDDKSKWPQLDTVGNSDSCNKRELKRKYSNIKAIATLVNVEESAENSWRLHPSRFSSWNRLTRVLAWVLRFINNCKQENKLKQVELNTEEISDAENHIIREMQKKEFKEEYSSLVKRKELPTHSKLLGLCPKLDSEGIMRSDG